MIKKLTKEQEGLFPQYVDKWLKIGLSTERIDYKKALYSASYLYKNILKKKEVPIIIFDSPLSSWIGLHLFIDSVKNSVGNSVRNSVDNSVRNSVRNSVWNSVGNSVENSVDNSVENSVWNSVRKKKLMSFIYPYINGNYMSGYFSFYDFINEVLGIEYVKDWQWYKQTSEQSLVYPLDNICIYSQKPIRISLNKSGVIHCDGKMAVEFADGWGVYALNGIIVSKEIAETPAENLDPKLILNEQNADIQREIIKKIGAERVLKKLNSKCLDKWTDPKTGKYYELLNLKVGSIDRKYMYYKHFSLDYYYAKPVPPEIRTAWQGRAWILGMIERNELPNAADEVINNLPTQAS